MEISPNGNVLLAGLSGYPVSGILSGFYIIPVSGSEYSTSTGFKPGSWFSVCTVYMDHCPVTCLYVTSSLCAVRVTGSYRQAALSGKVRMLSVVVPAIKSGRLVCRAL